MGGFRLPQPPISQFQRFASPAPADGDAARRAPEAAPTRARLLRLALAGAAGVLAAPLLSACGGPVAAGKSSSAAATSSSSKGKKTPAVKHLPAQGTPKWPVDPTTAQPTAGWSMYATSGTRIEMVAFGRDIWNKHDDCGFYYTTATGDGVWTAKVATQAATNAWAKSGIMLRNGTDPGSQMVTNVVTPGNGANIQWRPVKDNPCQGKGLDATASPPVWLRLQKKGDAFTFSDSTDGKTWQHATTMTLKGVIGAKYLVGLAACSHAPNLQGLVGFNDLSFKPAHYAAVIQTKTSANW